MEKQRIDISIGVILKTVLIFLLLWFLFAIRDVVVLLVIAVVIVAAIDPAVNYFQKKKIPRGVGVLFIYAFLLFFLGIGVSFILPPVVEQFEDFFKKMPVFLEEADRSLGAVNDFFRLRNVDIEQQSLLQNIGSGASNLSRGIFSTTIGVFSGIISVIVVFSLAFYMSIQEDGIKKFVVSVTPKKHRKYASDLTERIKEKIGKWLVGQFFLMILVFVFTFIGLSLIGVPYALILAFIAGLLEIIPYVGPIVAAIPGIILGFLVSPTVGLLTLLVYVVIQQLEGNVLAPQVMKKAVGLHPVTVIVALLAGAKLAGVLGAILAVPVATAVGLFVSDFMDGDKRKEM